MSSDNDKQVNNVFELSSIDWWKFYSSIPTLIGKNNSEQEINEILSKTVKSLGWVDNVAIRVGGEKPFLHLSFKHCKITFHKKRDILVDLGLLQSTGIKSAIVLLTDCEIKHCSNVINQTLKITAGDSFLRIDYFGVYNSKIEAELVCNNVKSIQFDNSSAYSLDTINATNVELLNKSEIEILTLGNSTESLSIKESAVFSLDIDELLAENKLKNLYFSQDSHIKSSAEQSYRKLRLLCKKDVLNNRIQTHLLYTKELDEYTSSGKKIDDKILFAANKLLNNHGRSFVQPLIIMYLLNVYLTFCLILANSTLIDFDFNQTIYESVIMGLNLSAISEYPNVTSKIEYGIDGFRRVVLALFSYATISSALRFKFRE